MKAILLAGGKGARLRPLTLNTPKPIVPIFNRPFLRYQLDLLRQIPDIDEVILSLNYQPGRIEDLLGDGRKLGVKLRYIVEPMPLGTAGAVKLRRGLSRRCRHRLQRRRADPDRPLRRHPTASRTRGARDDRSHAGGQSQCIRTRRNRFLTGMCNAFSRSPSPMRFPATPSTPASISSNPTPSIEFRRTRLGQSSEGFFPSLVERGERFRRLRVTRLLDRHRHAPQVPPGCIATSWTAGSQLLRSALAPLRRPSCPSQPLLMMT